MEQKKFLDYKDVAHYMISQHNTGKDIAAVMYFNAAETVIREILKNDEIKIGHFEFESEEYDYCGEYVVELMSDNTISVEPEYRYDEDRDGGYYVFIDDDIVLLDGDVHSSIIGKCETDTVIEICFDDATKDSSNYHNTYNRDEMIDDMFDSIFRFFFR